MQRTYPLEWNNIKNEITEIWENADGKTVRVCTSFGKKCLILVSAALLVSKDIQVHYLCSGRQSRSLEAHINKTINTLEREGVTVTVQPVECTLTKEDLGKTGSRCPIMTALKTIPENTIDIVGSVETYYDSPKIREQRQRWKDDPNRYLPLWGIDPRTLFYLHKSYVPHAIQFPMNSVTTCNSPLCPMVSEEALKGKTDWKR